MSDNLEFDSSTNTLYVGSVEGVVYRIDGKDVEGEVQLEKDTVVTAHPIVGRFFPKGTVTEFRFEVVPVVETPAPVQQDEHGENSGSNYGLS